MAETHNTEKTTEHQYTVEFVKEKSQLDCKGCQKIIIDPESKECQMCIIFDTIEEEEFDREELAEWIMENKIDWLIYFALLKLSKEELMSALYLEFKQR